MDKGYYSPDQIPEPGGRTPPLMDPLRKGAQWRRDQKPGKGIIREAEHQPAVSEKRPTGNEVAACPSDNAKESLPSADIDDDAIFPGRIPEPCADLASMGQPVKCRQEGKGLPERKGEVRNTLQFRKSQSVVN